MRKWYFVLVVLVIVLVGCTLGPGDEPGPDAPAGLANPASVYCEEQGGELEIRENEGGGQYGVCLFEDGSECEEWAFFRGECAPGDSLNTEG